MKLKLKSSLMPHKRYVKRKNIVYISEEDIIKEYEILKNQSININSINPLELWNTTKVSE